MTKQEKAKKVPAIRPLPSAASRVSATVRLAQLPAQRGRHPHTLDR